MARFKDNDPDSVGLALCVQYHIDNTSATDEAEAFALCPGLREWRDLIIADPRRIMRDCSEWIAAKELAGTWSSGWYRGVLFTFKLTMPNSIRRVVMDGIGPNTAAHIICAGRGAEVFTGADLRNIKPLLGNNIDGIYYANDTRHLIDEIQ